MFFFLILKFSPKQKASSRGPEPGDDVFCFGLNFNISKLVYLKPCFTKQPLNVFKLWCE